MASEDTWKYFNKHIITQREIKLENPITHTIPGCFSPLSVIVYVDVRLHGELSHLEEEH